MTGSIPPITQAIPDRSKLEILHERWHNVSIEYRKLVSAKIRELHDEGISHGIKDIAEALVEEAHKDLVDKMEAASGEYNKEMAHITDAGEKHMRVMARAAKYSLDRAEEDQKRYEKALTQTREYRTQVEGKTETSKPDTPKSNLEDK